MQMYHRLTQLMDEEIAVYQEMLVVKEREYRMTQVSDLYGVQTCNEQLVTLIDEAKHLETQRETLVDELLEQIADPKTPRTVSALSQHLPAPYNAHVAWQARKLSETVTKLSEVNERNGHLLREAIGFINEMINWLVRSVNRQQTYAANGKPSQQVLAPELLNQQV